MTFKRLVISFGLLVISLLVFPLSVFAASSTQSTLPVAFPPSSALPLTLSPLPSYIPPTSPVYTDLLISNMFHTFSCLAIGQSVIGQPCLTYQISKNTQGAIQSIPVLSQVNLQGGTLGAVTNVITLLYKNPPVRTADYLASVGQSFGVVKEAHAQVGGSGADVLSPIIALWSVSRDISYVLMVIIFVVIGLMVMFRQKINPQTVVTAQAAIPGLVIGLILITFSFFLAGLLTDTAFVGTNLVGAYFSAAMGHASKPQNLVSDVQHSSVLTIFSHFVGDFDFSLITSVLQPIFDSLNPDVQNKLQWFIGLLAFQFIAPLGSVIGPGWGIIASAVGGIAAGVLAYTSPVQTIGFFLQFVAIFILLYAMFRLLLRLISCYLHIIFLTITAPFQFLYASLPGRQGVATGWLLNMMGNILVFPAVLAVFYFVAYLLGDTAAPFTEAYSINHMNNTFVPTVFAQGPINTFVGNTKLPLFGDLNLSFLQSLIAFGALLALPSIPDIIVRIVGSASQHGQMIGQEINTNIVAGQGHFTQSVSRGTGGLDTVGKGIFGESQYFMDPKTNEPRRKTTVPGLKHRLFGIPKVPSGTETASSDDTK